MLVEVAFITNARESVILQDAQFQTKFAEHLTQGIAAYKVVRDRAVGAAGGAAGTN